MTGNLIIISSPSGGGKGTLIRHLLETLPDIGYSVSFTTRARRRGEEHGKDYFFVSEDEFEHRRREGEFLEFARVHGNMYGTSRNITEGLIAEGRDVILEIDVQGADAVRKKMPGAVSIFILPPSFEVLKKRLTSRSTESAEELALRLANATEEVQRYTDFEYVVVNDSLVEACERLESIVLAERQRRIRQTDRVQTILDSFDVST
jgi:guanylate kinase